MKHSISLTECVAILYAFGLLFSLFTVVRVFALVQPLWKQLVWCFILLFFNPLGAVVFWLRRRGRGVASD